MARPKSTRPRKLGPSERVEFNGERFRRYPEAEDRAKRVYFFSQRGRSLHRAVWEHAHGAIPVGKHVHHKDGDPLNNDIGNLELRDGREHLSEHASAPGRADLSRRSLGVAREAARVWHGSEEGRAWHREHGRATWVGRAMHECVCVVCGGGFQSKVAGTQVCSGKCHAKRRRDSGVDDVVRTCERCGVDYRASRFKRGGYCSRSCATSHRYERERAGVQPERARDA